MISSSTVSLSSNYCPYHDTILPIKRRVERILDKYTALIESVGILTITTCLLAAKIFENTPPIIPRAANVLYNYGGIIWLNVQSKDFLRRCNDLSLVAHEKRWAELIPTAAKVFLSASSLLLTVTYFSASVIALYGYPQLMMSMVLSIQPLSLGNYFTGVVKDFYDYKRNITLIDYLGSNDLDEQALVDSFSTAIHQREPSENTTAKTYLLATSILLQLDWEPYRRFREMDTRLITKAMLLESIANTNTYTVNNLGLIALGRLCMGISKAFPESFADMSGRWLMSALYTWNIAWYTWTNTESSDITGT